MVVARERMKGFFPIIDSALGYFKFQRARHLLESGYGDLDICIDFIANADLINRYNPKHKKDWMNWVDSFVALYKLEKVPREKVQEGIVNAISPFTQVVMIEMLWEFGEGTDRQYWLKDLLRALWQHPRTEDKDRHELMTHLHFSNLPREIKNMFEEK